MFRKVLSLVIIACMIFATNTFAFKWENENGEWYAVDDNIPIRLGNQLINDNGLIYFTNEDGKLITGWYVKPENQNVYFFDTKEGTTKGLMVFGLKSIDGKFYYFNADGSLVRSKSEGEYIKAFVDNFNEYWTNNTGELYLNNELVTTDNSDYLCGYTWIQAKDLQESTKQVDNPIAQSKR